MQWEDRIGRRLKLRDLHILLAVVQCGNMSKAARQLSVSNPVVTKAVADLEHTLGVRLLDRTPRGVDLTVYGRALLDRGLVAFDELRQAVKHIEFLANPTAGEVRIACSLATSIGFVVAVIERLSRRFPRIVFNVQAGPEADASRALEERTVDLLIGRMFSLIVEDHLNAEILYDDPFVIAAGVRNPWVRRRKIDLAELMNEPWVLPPADSPFGSVIEEAFRAAGLKVPASTVIASAVPMRNALLASGRFLTIVPSSLLRFSGHEPTAKPLPIELPIARRPIGAMTLKNRMLNPLAQLFIDCARDLAKQLAKRK
jgi:DNA-binding transcriptional LysR family regulator